jgi:CHAT domain-containing protein/Tfp pilus assembly protein PilF
MQEPLLWASNRVRNIVAAAILVACLQVSVAARTPQAAPPAQTPSEASSVYPRQQGKLRAHKPIEHELKGGETDAYTIKVKKGQFLQVVVEQKGVDIVLSIVAPDGKTIVAADSPNGAWGPEPASAIASESGNLQIQVAASDKNAPPGSYEVRIESLHAPGPTSQLRIEAERNFFAAAKLGARPDVENHRKALAQYEKALAQWRELRDIYEEGLTLQGIGELRSDLRDDDKALDADSKALEIWRAEKNDRARTATLTAMGKIYDLRSQQQKAMDCYNEALAAARSTGDRAAEANLLNQLGLAYDNQGDHHKAIELFDQALVLERLTGNRQEELEVLTNTAISYAQLGEKQKAVDLTLQNLALAREIRDQFAEAHLLATLGVLCTGRGEMEKGIQYFLASLAIFRALGDRTDEGAILTNLGHTYDVLGDRKTAVDYFSQSLPISRETGDRYWETITLMQIGSAYNNLGERQKAIEYYTQALTISRAMVDRKEESACLSNIGGVYLLSGESEKALDYFGQALTNNRARGDRQGEATSLDNIGSAYNELGDKQKALDYFTQSLTIARAVGDRDGEATGLNNIGRLYRDLGQNKKALEFLQQSFEIEHSLHRASKEIIALQNVGSTLALLGEPQQALSDFDEALALAQNSGDRPSEASVLHNLGKFYEENGDQKKALSFYERALPLERAVEGRSGEAGTLNNIAEIYSNLGQREQALDDYSRALAIARSVKDPLLEASILANLMTYWKNGNNPALAAFFGKQAVNSYQLVRGKIQGLDRDSQKSFVESKSGTYRQLAEILIGQGRLSEAEQVLDLLKNEEYFEFIRRSGADAASLTGDVTLNPIEKQKEARYRELGEQIAAAGRERSDLLASKSRTPEEESRLADLTKAVETANNNFQTFLHDLNSELGSSEQAGERVSEVEEKISSLQNALRGLPAGTVGLYTFVGDEKYHVIVVTREISVERHYDIQREQLRDKVERFREALRSPGDNPVSLAQQLYKILLGPAEKDLLGARAKMLMLSLNDVLRYIPFAALHDGRQYVVKRYRTEIFTTASLLNLKDKPSISSWRGLGMGVSKSVGGMPALPTVPDELHQIIHDTQDTAASGVLPGRVMLDEAFTENAMKIELKKNYPLVHIASHFVSAPGNERDSYLLLGEGEGKHLTLEEIRSNPDISFGDIELLTLSACNTATGGKSDGREIDGLGMMAQRKGAKAVVASLWDVNDNSTGQLMADFYRRWIHTPGMTKADALRLAQLDLLHGTALHPDTLDRRSKKPSGTSAVSGASQPMSAYSHPYYWAPFILIGNWR